jgi:hypothetical protein
MFGCVHTAQNFSVMTRHGKMFYFTSAATISELSDIVVCETKTLQKRSTKTRRVKGFDFKVSYDKENILYLVRLIFFTVIQR